MLNLNDIREKEFLPQVRWQKETHTGLWLDKYLGDQSREKVESRRDLIEEVSLLPIPTAYQTYFKRWQERLTEYGAEPRKARVKGRMIIGLGSESIVETSISLHRTYGVPYIPGSALKGLAANYARLYLDADWQKGGTYYKVVFGDADDSGYITFFDALYIPGSGHPNSDHKEQALYPDVITVHHPEYYQGAKEVPSDSDSPTPVPFLSAAGTYLIALAAPDLEQPEGWISMAFQVLENALKTLGVGAKTSSGYGRMELEPPPIDHELKKAEGYKREIDALINVAGQIHGFYQKWQQLESEQARLFLAQAIVDRVRQVGREKATAGKAWYQELQAFLDAPQP